MNTSQDFRRGIEELDTKEEKRDFIKNFLTGIKDDAQSWQQAVQNMPDGPKKMEQLKTIRRNMQNKFPEIVNKIIQAKETLSGTISITVILSFQRVNSCMKFQRHNVQSVSYFVSSLRSSLLLSILNRFRSSTSHFPWEIRLKLKLSRL